MFIACATICVYNKKGKNIHVCIGLYIPSVSRGWLAPRRGAGRPERERERAQDASLHTLVYVLIFRPEISAQK